MYVTVKLFARARDLAGTDRVDLDVADAGSVRDLKRSLADRYPQLSPLVSSMLVAVGNEYAVDDAPLLPGVELACFPPVSGG